MFKNQYDIPGTQPLRRWFSKLKIFKLFTPVFCYFRFGLSIIVPVVRYFRYDLAIFNLAIFGSVARHFHPDLFTLTNKLFRLDRTKFSGEARPQNQA